MKSSLEPGLLLINPWVHDFAAYDLWARPLGLLTLAAHLRNQGFRVRVLDFLDRTLAPWQGRRSGPHGTGKYHREGIPRPPVLAAVPRTYSRYGLPPAVVEARLRDTPRPAAVLVTSFMTYWYPGVKESVEAVRRVFPDVPALVGGIYVRLCPEHARRVIPADAVVPTVDPGAVLTYLEGLGVFPDGPGGSAPFPPYPAFDLLGGRGPVAIMTATGCPFRCRYCASPRLNPRMVARDPAEVLDEILHWHRTLGTMDFAFYDDALLHDFDARLGPLLEGILRTGLRLRFHTPNALHVCWLDREVSGMLFRAGFQTIRLGLESAEPSFHRDMDAKVGEGDFERAMASLKGAGFIGPQIGAYILMGLPGQSPQSVLDTVSLASCLGAFPHLAEYSPIPGTDLWKTACASSAYDLEGEPLFHNSTLLPCWDEAKRAQVPILKRRVQELRTELRQGWGRPLPIDTDGLGW